MPSGSCSSLAELPTEARALLFEARRAVMSTIDSRGRPHSVPISFAQRGENLITPIDHKPKAGVVTARVRNIERNPAATVLADRWDEDWTNLGWTMVRAAASVEQTDSEGATALLERYPQYADMEEHDAFIVLRPQRITWWTYT